ncbi:flagellar filament capping protein FliD [Romboutsia sedimentorum]|uniref:flagellar filament capping protein FliD n=1 Tax=Romboutsia sedimentorum TaxID=1368474 RepID=UPI0024DE3FA1|nr:flagellar filament capping protein FliD [Romboutsia sedimentorum]MDK2585817.1 flagellar filament capping protein FliD [Romboutsia sedimentorum]
MSSVSGIRLPGLASGMDTGTMVKEMLAGEQHKVDKVKQKEQTTKWQQEVYREVIKDMKGFNDKYFSLSSENSILNSNAWSTLTVNSSNSNVITATGNVGANKVDYKFEVNKLAEAAKATSSATFNNGKNTTLKDLNLDSSKIFKIELGKNNKGETIYSKEITITVEDTYKTITVTKLDDKGNPIQKTEADGTLVVDADGKPVYETEEKKVIEHPADTIESLAKKINEATDGQIKASYSEMTGKFTIQSTKTGENIGFRIEGDALDFLNLGGNSKDDKFIGSNSEIKVTSKDGSSYELNKESNSFTIDGITYDVHSTTKSGETVDITSKQDVKPVVDNMKKFVEDYNKIMEKVYDLVTQKANRDYPPLTEAQKEDMSEDEIERWEKKAKQGILRNDSEMRRFMDDMQKSIFGGKMEILNEMGLTSHEDYNKRGQISLNEDKFIKALENNGERVYEVFAKDSSSIIESMRSTMNKYVGGSSSVFAKKAGIEKTASIANNFYSEQLKRQGEAIKILQMKMDKKESELYKKFGGLEASMNKLNSQMSYFMQA